MKNSQWTILISYTQILGGLFGLVTVVALSLLPALDELDATSTAVEHISLWLTHGALFAMYGFVLISGVLLLRKYKHGTFLSLCAQGIQVPFCIVGGFTYYFVAGLSFMLGVEREASSIGITVNALIASDATLNYGPDTTMQLSINIVAVIFFLHLYRRISQDKKQKISQALVIFAAIFATVFVALFSMVKWAHVEAAAALEERKLVPDGQTVPLDEEKMQQAESHLHKFGSIWKESGFSTASQMMDEQVRSDFEALLTSEEGKILNEIYQEYVKAVLYRGQLMEFNQELKGVHYSFVGEIVLTEGENIPISAVLREEEEDLVIVGIQYGTSAASVADFDAAKDDLYLEW